MRLALAVALVALWFAVARADHAINTLIGDASWAGHIGSASSSDEVTRIRAHLGFVHALLAKRDVSELPLAQRTARESSLADLARYIDRGEFPRRTNDSYEGRRPRFIDDRGVHCAVGQLIADTGDEDLAQTINARFEYAHVRDMSEPALATWAHAHGFTVDELALIQPSYHGVPTPDAVRRMVIEAKDWIALECGREHKPMTDLFVAAINDKRGATTVTTKSTEPFAQCFVRRASGLDRGGHAYRGGPREFSFGIDLSLPTPQQQLENRMAKWSPSCMPRPGTIPREATIEVWSTNETFSFEAKTTPSNALVESCMKEEGKRAFSDFGPGSWKLHATKKIALPSYVRLDAQSVAFYAREVATDCNPSPRAKEKSTVTITAMPDDKQFTIGATGSPDFSICVSEKLNKRFEQQYRTSYVADGKRIDFFRIDAKVNISVTIDLESAAARMQRLEAERQRMEIERNRIDF